jgi:hypothetical protein
MSEYKPGDVAVAMIHDQAHVIFRVDIEGQERWVDRLGLATWPRGREIRPLVVIDPEDREQVERLYGLMWSVGTVSHERGRLTEAEQREDADDLQAALREFANPKPAEPTGLGAVVEDEAGLRWVHYLGRVGWKWCGSGPNHDGVRDYADIDAVRVLSEGVQP